MDYTLSNHAKRVLLERGIPTEWAERVLADPELRQPEPEEPSLERLFRRIPEFEGRVLRVVVNNSAEPRRVVSVFFDRRMKGKL